MSAISQERGNDLPPAAPTITLALMFSRALLLLLVATMATMPSVASACALNCVTDQSGMPGTGTTPVSGDCGHKAPDSGNPGDLGMASLCAFAAAGAISISPATACHRVTAAPASYFPKRILSQVPHLPDRPPRV